MGNQYPSNPYVGGVNTIPVIPTGRLKIEMDERIYRLNFEKNILQLLMTRMKKRVVKQSEFNWMTKERKADVVATTAVGGSWASSAAASGTLTVATANAWLFAKNDVIMLPSISTTKNIFITAVNQGTGVITAQLVDSGATIDLSAVGSSLPSIFRVATSVEVGAGKSTIKSYQPTRNYNYIQRFQTPFGVTTEQQSYEMAGPDELSEQRQDAATDHLFEIEKAYFFGERKHLTTGLTESVYDQYFTGGVKSFLSTNVVDVSGNLTETAFYDWLIDATRYAAPKGSIIIAGEILFEAAVKWAKNKLQIVQSEKTLGMQIANILTPYGISVPLVSHRELLCNDWAGYGFCLDMSDIQEVVLAGLDTHVATELQANDVEQRIDEFRSWKGLQLGNEKRHGMIYGITGITVS